MNKRIQDLAESCTTSCVDGRGVELNEIDIEQFSGLIIEECAKRAEVYAYMSPNFTALAEELRSMKGVE